MLLGWPVGVKIKTGLLSVVQMLLQPGAGQIVTSGFWWFVQRETSSMDPQKMRLEGLAPTTNSKQ